MAIVAARMYLPAGHGVYYTSKGSVVYALAMGWPEGNSLLLRTPVPSAHVAVSMLGCDKPMAWVRSHRPLGILRRTLDLPDRPPESFLRPSCPNRNALKPSLCSSE